MGRFGTLLLISGETELQLSAKAGEIVRLWQTNTAGSRVFSVHLPGARLKLNGGDSGRYEREEFVQELLAPSERAVVDVRFDTPGRFQLEHITPDRTYPLAAVTVTEEPATPSLEQHFQVLRRAPELAAERQKVPAWLAAAPDKTLALVAQMDDLTIQEGPLTYACPMHPGVVSDQPGRCPKCGMNLQATQTVSLTAADQPSMTHAAHDDPAILHDQHRSYDHDREDHGHSTGDGIEWEDDMVEVNRQTTTANTHWKFVDRTTGTDSTEIDWRFTVGDRVKIRLINEMESDHPMHHPFHIHGLAVSWSWPAMGSPNPTWYGRTPC